jgi:aquaporin Z
MHSVIRRHLPEYLMEAAGLGLFMVSACLFTILLEHPASPVRQAVADPLIRRALIGLAMGLTAISIIYSPWGKQSGAHLNPAVTLTFLRLGKIRPADALGYATAQFLGGLAGVLLVAVPLMSYLADQSVNYAVTVPGADGPSTAFVGEMGISFGLMLVVLTVSNTPRLARFTGLVAGALVATYITLEAPLSGMSMNPARTVASALPARVWTDIWIYFTAPVFGMLAAAEVFARIRRTRDLACPKLHHDNPMRCIFCGKPAL